MDIYKRALAYFLSSYLFLLTAWCVLDGQSAGRPPLLLIGAPAGLALLPPLPARELPTPPEPPLEFYSSLEGARIVPGEAGSDAVLVFSHPLNVQQEPHGAGLQVLLYPVDRTSLIAQTAPLREAGFTVACEPMSRFACRLIVTAPGTLSPHIPAGGGEGRGKTLVLSFHRQDAPVARASDEEEDEDASRPRGTLEERARKEVAPGLEHRRLLWTANGGAQSTVNVIDLDPARAPVKLELGTGTPVMRHRTKLSEMGRRAGALAGLNAGYFAMNGNPLGTLIDRGKVIVSPIYGRSSFGVYQQRTFLFGNPEFSGRVRLPGGELVAASLNEKRLDGKVVVYTPEFGESTKTTDEGVEVAVAGGRVVGVGEMDLAIPEDGIVIAAHGGEPDILDEVSVGDPVTFDWGVTPPWNLCDVAVGGGPRLLRDGKIDVNARQERFDAQFSGTRAPRSAVGATRDGHMLLVAIDGRRPPLNHGATLTEMASLMRELGCVNAVNLDGGGSTQMWVSGKIVNTPSDGREREISTAILIVPRDAMASAR